MHCSANGLTPRPHVKAVVIRINSPGGAVTASDIMYQDLCRFREQTHKPVVACMMDVAASGGYYLAMGCDRIYAHPTTVTGSIGVIMSLYNAAGLFGMIGVKSDPIKSGPNKDIGNPGRPMTDEERAILQHMVTNFYEQFIGVVVKGRSGSLGEERIRALADGRVYTGLEAKELGLVDEIGYLEDAIKAAKDMACVKDAAVIAYDRCEGFRGCIYSAAPRIPSQISVKLDLPGPERCRRWHRCRVHVSVGAGRSPLIGLILPAILLSPPADPRYNHPASLPRSGKANIPPPT